MFCGLLSLGYVSEKSASAQTRDFSLSASMGSGLSFGTGSGEMVLDRSPMFFDLGVMTSRSDEPQFSYGGVLRIEVDGRTSVAAVPRIAWVSSSKHVELRPFAGFPFFFVPFSMFGLELGCAARFNISESFGMLTTVTWDAYIWGSDVPEGSAVIMINATVGVELAL